MSSRAVSPQSIEGDRNSPDTLQGQIAGSPDLRKGLLGDEEATADANSESEKGSISITQILSLKERFDRADTDGGGSLDLQEFMDAFGSIINKNGSMSDDQIKRLFMQIDANSDGGIDWNEFSTYMLMESMSGDSVASQKAGSFYLPDPAGQRQAHDHFHRDSVDCAQVDPSGMFYITTAKDGSIRLWKQGTVQLEKTISLGHTWVLAMTVLPFLGRLAVSTDDRKIKFYDIHTWEVALEVELQSPALCLCSWKHLDTDMFAYGNDTGEITIVDLGKGLKPAAQLQNQLAGRKLVKRPKSWTESRTRIVHEGWVNQICKIDDLGGVVSCGSDNAIVIFEVPFRANPDNKDWVLRRRVLEHTRGHQKGVKCFEWVQTFKLIVSGGLERELIVWNPYTCKPVLTLNGHTSGIKMMQLNAEYEQLVSLSLDRVIKVWDLRNNECIQTITNFKRSKMKPTCVAIDRQRNRMISFGQQHQVFKINSQILSNTLEDTHKAPVVAVLYNRIFGNVVTVAQDSECAIWRPLTGEQIFSFFDTERSDDTHITCANFDEAGRRLMTGDHEGVVRVWNFNSGACIKTLVKPKDGESRQEITGVCCYIFEDKRFIAAASWDRKITVWMDFSEDAGTITPYMQMQGQESDVLSLAFTYPKSIAAACADGSIGIFDVESGYKKMSMASEREATAQTPCDATQRLGSPLFISKIIFLLQRNCTLVSAAADGNLRFWQGQWMPTVPAQCATSVAPTSLACLIPGNHYHGAAIVDVRTDDENKFLVTADDAGFLKTWRISDYNWKTPDENQVVPIALWQAHQVGISSMDIMVPAGAHFIDGEEDLSPLVFSCASDRCAVLWTLDGCHVGKFGQPLAGRATPWQLYSKETWQADETLDILGEQDSAFASPLSRQYASDGSDDSADFEAVMQELDQRLKTKASTGSRTLSSCFEGHNGLPVAKLDAVPTKETKKKGKEYSVDEITGERIYKSGPSRKAAVGEEKKKPSSIYIKHLTKKLELLQPHASDAKGSQLQNTAADPRDADKITHATASVLIKVFEAKCEGQGWGEPEGIHKDSLCTKIRAALQVKSDPSEDVDKVARYLSQLGTNWDEMLSLADMETLS